MSDYLQATFGLAGRKAVVTGAGRGIGAATAKALAAAGAEVAVHYHTSKDRAESVVNAIEKTGGTAWAIGADLTDAKQVNDMFEQVAQHWDTLDILVNNAGDLVQRCDVKDMTDDLFERTLRVNIHSAMYCCRAAIALMHQSVGPAIVNLGSVAGHNGGAGGAAVYAMTKGAIHTFTRGLAKEVAPRIRVNAIAPGIILTDFHDRHTSPELMQKLTANNPLGRAGCAEDCAHAVIYLASAASAYITGEIIEINGGMWFA